MPNQRTRRARARRGEPTYQREPSPEPSFFWNQAIAEKPRRFRRHVKWHSDTEEHVRRSDGDGDIKRLMQAFGFMHRRIGMCKTEDELWQSAHVSMICANHFVMMCDDSGKRERVRVAFERFGGECAEDADKRRRFMNKE